MRRRAIVLGALLAAAAAAAAPAAEAALTCGFDPLTRELTVTATATTDRPVLTRAGDQIAVRSDDQPVDCTGPGPTVTTTDAITVTDASSGGQPIVVDLSGGPLAPGASAEGQFGTPEIEIAVAGGAGADTLGVSGTAAADTFRAGTSAGAARVNLNTGELVEDADVVTSGVEAVVLDGEGGDDHLDARGGAGTGDPVAVAAVLAGDGGDDWLHAGAQASYLLGGEDDDHLAGGPKRDTLTPGRGDDAMDGQGGFDVVTFQGVAGQGVTVDLDETSDQDTGEGVDRMVRVEEVMGTDADDVLRGDEGPNRLTAVGGDDLVEGRGGDDTLEGGPGRDHATFRGAGAGVTVDLAAPAPQATGGAGADVLDEVEDVSGSPHGDLIAGDGAANALDGAAGTDGLDGRGGSDTLDGGRGAGSEADGPDSLDGGPGVDTIAYSRRLGGVAVTLDGLANDGADPDGDGVSEEGDEDEGVENVTGGAGDDRLFTPGTGVNTLTGGLGNDWLAGGFGSDRLDGGAGTDTISYAQRSARVAVRLDGVRNDGGDPNGDGTSGAGEERDLDVGVENAVGGSGGDRLRASGDVDNLLQGGGGADVLDGGFGTDVLDGGPGTDTISYVARVTRVAVTLNGLADDGADGDADGASEAGEEADQDKGIESVLGGAGPDRLTGLLAAAITLTGGGGNDRLDAKDGAATPDHLDCGPGALDVVVADPADTSAGCEATPAP